MKFKNLAAVIAIPDLLTPGIKDKIWKTPINTADFKSKSFLILFFILNLSLINNKIPKIIVVHAIVSMFLIFSIRLVSTNKNPTNITGIEEIIIFNNKSLF